jgi:hypothetical protein
MLEKSSLDLKEKMLAHLERGLALAQYLEKPEPSPEAPEKLSQFEADSQEISRRLEEQAKALESDPLASPKWTWGMSRLSRQISQARESHLAPARKASSEGDPGKASQELERYLEEAEKAASAFDELKKEQKMSDAVSSAGHLEDLAGQLENALSDAKNLEELQGVLEAMDEEFAKLAQTLSQMDPKELPQEFINQLPPEDLPMGQVADAKSELAEALRQGDFKRAKEAARKMLEGLREMRKNMEEAAQSYQQKPQKLLGGEMPAGSQAEASSSTVAGDLQALRRDQEKLFWDTGALEQAIRRRELASGSTEQTMTPQEGESAQGQGQSQEGLANRSGELLKELADMDRGHPTLVLGDLVTKLESAHGDQEQAGVSLKAGDLPRALEAQGRALKKLEEMGEDLQKLSRELSGMPFGSGGNQPGGRRPLILVPSPASGYGEAEGSRGFRFGEVRIPRPQDYKVPEEERQEILRSLQERAPRSLENEVGEYLKNLLK